MYIYIYRAFMYRVWQISHRNCSFLRFPATVASVTSSREMTTTGKRQLVIDDVPIDDHPLNNG